MPAQGISMHKLSQLVRLHIEAKLSTRNIGRSLSLSVGVVSKYINRIKQLNMNNDDLLGMNESSVAELLQPKTIELRFFWECSRNCVTISQPNL